MKEVLERKDIQFIAWVVLLILAVAVPFVAYGERLNQLEKRMEAVDTIHAELSVTLTDMQVRLATIQKDIEYLKAR